MALLTDIKNRQIQRKANNFIDSLKNKSDSEIEQAYLNTKEFQNNEIVLSYLFFNHTSLIRILPLEFQKSRINSNLSMFYYGSEEAKKELVVSWFHDNKFFMNALVVGFSEDEYENYIKLYFSYPDDIVLLFMDDLKKVVTILSNSDLRKTEDILIKIKDKLSTRQWEYIIEVNPLFIKYANQEVQSLHTDDEEYIRFLNGSAKEEYNQKQIEKIKDDISQLDLMDRDVQLAYLKKYPFMINYLSDEIIINTLKDDIDLMKFVNLSISKNKSDKTQEVVCSILESIENKTSKEIVDILVNKCLLNAKGKLYRFDPKSNDISYQYTKRVIKSMQNLSIDQIITLIMIDVNYILPYVVPIYNDNIDRSEKEKIAIDCNSRCLNVFKKYYGEDTYNQYYKLINRIYSEYIANIEKYDFSRDYRCIFDLLKVLFNKRIIQNNNYEKISIFIGTSLMYKDNVNENAIKLLNDIISNAYNVNVNNNREIYNINSLELFDSRLSFIKSSLLNDFSKYNFVNISNLLLIIKSDKMYDLFKDYYEIMIYIYGESKETLYRIIENFNYYKNILKNVKDEELNEEEKNNLVNLLSTFFNQDNITNKEELANYEIIALKRLVNELSTVKDEKIYKNVLCNYLFSKGYDEKGYYGWLECDTIKQICDLFEIDSLKNFKINGELLFSEDENKLFTMIKLLFSVNDYDLLFSFVENIINNKINRNILSSLEFFNKIKKYKIDIINNQIVSLDEIESLYLDRPDIVIKNTKDGIDIYTVVGQDFRVLCSVDDNGETYNCVNVSELDKNVYAYDYLTKEGSIRLISEEDKTVIKVNKDNYDDNQMKASFIIVTGKMNDDILEIAKENNLKIVEVQS